MTDQSETIDALVILGILVILLSALGAKLWGESVLKGVGLGTTFMVTHLGLVMVGVSLLLSVIAALLATGLMGNLARVHYRVTMNVVLGCVIALALFFTVLAP